MFRYGSLLFIPFFDGTLIILICCVVGIVLFKIYHSFTQCSTNNRVNLFEYAFEENYSTSSDGVDQKRQDDMEVGNQCCGSHRLLQNTTKSGFQPLNMKNASNSVPLIHLLMKHNNHNTTQLPFMPSSITQSITTAATPTTTTTTMTTMTTANNAPIPLTLNGSSVSTLDNNNQNNDHHASLQHAKESQPINLDQLDVHEAFRLAKMKYTLTETKATV